VSEKISPSSQIVKRAFREYYFNKENLIEEPDNIQQREFGYSLFEKAGMIRHLSFNRIKELEALLVREVPSDIYCSNAYYRFPALPMQEKQWLGADLIFDIDGKDLNLPCLSSHSYLKCINCKQICQPDLDLKKIEKEYSCESCSSKKVETIIIPCDKCIEGSKKEVKRLMNFLVEDFGLQKEDVHIYFSGNNGFHIHVLHNEFLSLDSQARSDIVGYISGIGILLQSIGVEKDTSHNGISKVPKEASVYGWRRRIANTLKVDWTSPNKLKHMVESKGGYVSFKEEIEKLSREMGARIDPQVTTDVHRIFRMPGSLNSKSSLAKAKCDNLDSFDPFTDACVLGSAKVNIKVMSQIKFKMKDKSFKISKESAELPTYAAVYLLCKGLAEAT
jgi:DNA primase small subunit